MGENVNVNSFEVHFENECNNIVVCVVWVNFPYVEYASKKQATPTKQFSEISARTTIYCTIHIDTRDTTPYAHQQRCANFVYTF